MSRGTSTNRVAGRAAQRPISARGGGGVVVSWASVSPDPVAGGEGLRGGFPRDVTTSQLATSGGGWVAGGVPRVTSRSADDSKRPRQSASLVSRRIGCESVGGLRESLNRTRGSDESMSRLRVSGRTESLNR